MKGGLCFIAIFEARILCSISMLYSIALRITFPMVVLTDCSAFSFPTGDAHLLECLHLLRHYSSSASVRGKAGVLVERLGAGGSPPNPGTWSNKQVALWLDSISVSTLLKSRMGLEVL